MHLLEGGAEEDWALLRGILCPGEVEALAAASHRPAHCLAVMTLVTAKAGLIPQQQLAIDGCARRGPFCVLWCRLHFYPRETSLCMRVEGRRA